MNVVLMNLNTSLSCFLTSDSNSSEVAPSVLAEVGEAAVEI